MVEIFGKQNRKKEGKEKERGGKRKRRQASGHGLWTQTALQANRGRQCGLVEGAWLWTQADSILGPFNLDKLTLLGLRLPTSKMDR